LSEGSNCRLPKFIVRSRKAVSFPYIARNGRVELIAVKRLVYAGFRGHRLFKTCGRLAAVPTTSPRRALGY
jgi:hypothetical protein